MAAKFVILLVALVVASSEARVYDRCDLARELRYRYNIPAYDISKWVCIAKHESDFNTAAYNGQSGDHGIFQISHLYWCSPPGTGCGVSCDALRDDNIADDVACALRVKNTQGFSAWVAYNKYCTGDTAGYTSGCF